MHSSLENLRNFATIFQKFLSSRLTIYSIIKQTIIVPKCKQNYYNFLSTNVAIYKKKKFTSSMRSIPIAAHSSHATFTARAQLYSTCGPMIWAERRRLECSGRRDVYCTLCDSGFHDSGTIVLLPPTSLTRCLRYSRGLFLYFYENKSLFFALCGHQRLWEPGARRVFISVHAYIVLIDSNDEIVVGLWWMGGFFIGFILLNV